MRVIVVLHIASSSRFLLLDSSFALNDIVIALVVQMARPIFILCKLYPCFITPLIYLPFVSYLIKFQSVLVDNDFGVIAFRNNFSVSQGNLPSFNFVLDKDFIHSPGTQIVYKLNSSLPWTLSLYLHIEWQFHQWSSHRLIKSCSTDLSRNTFLVCWSPSLNSRSGFFEKVYDHHVEQLHEGVFLHSAIYQAQFWLTNMRLDNSRTYSLAVATSSYRIREIRIFLRAVMINL